MKSKRHSAILEIIEKCDIETQEELISALNGAGFNVTQATVSRDIRELKLTKTSVGGSKYKYALASSGDKGGHKIYSSTLTASIISIDCAMNMIVVKTYPGMAQAVAAGIDSADVNGVMGCVAGDDTIFIATRSADDAAAAADSLRNISGK